MADVEQHVLFLPSFFVTGILPEFLLENDAGGCISFVRMVESELDSMRVA